MDILSITSKSSVSADAEVYTKDGNDFVTTTFDALYNNSSAKTNIEKSVSDANARIDTTNNTVAELDNYARAKGSGIVLQSQGEMVTVNDSSDDYMVNLKPYGKSEQDSTTGAQLYDVNSYVGSMVTIDEDGWCTVEYDNTNGAGIYYIGMNTPASELLTTSTDYAIIAEVQSVSNVQLQYVTSVTSSNMGQFNSSSSAKTAGTFVTVATTREDFTDCTTMLRSVVAISAGASGSIKFRLSVVADTSITADTFVYEKYTGGQPSPNPDYPQEIRSTVISEVRSCGKNLFDVFAWKSGQPDSDGWVTLSYDNTSSTTSRQLYLLTAVSEFLLANTQYRVVVEVESISNAVLRAVSHGKSSQFAEELKITKVGKYFSTIRTKNDFSESANMLCTYLSISAGVSGSAKFRISVLEDIFITADTFVYEPYTETVAQLSEPITLYGIPTDSNGNFTDSNGQQWIADYIDVTKGKVVRCVNTETFDGSTDEKWNIQNGDRNFFTIDTSKHALSGTNLLCNIAPFGNVAVYNEVLGVYIVDTHILRYRYEINNNLTVDDVKQLLSQHNMIIYYPLATPTEEDLPTDDIVALKNLKTFYSVTNVTNDSEVKGEMVLSYNADTKMYIDNKFAELAAQLV